MSTPSRSSFLSKLRKYGWPGLAIVSLLLNVGLVGWLGYVNTNQYLLTNITQNMNCSTDGYARWMTKMEQQEKDVKKTKKFIAASLCFTDHETGKPIDLDSIKPKIDSAATYPPRSISRWD